MAEQEDCSGFSELIWRCVGGGYLQCRSLWHQLWHWHSVSTGAVWQPLAPPRPTGSFSVVNNTVRGVAWQAWQAW